MVSIENNRGFLYFASFGAKQCLEYRIMSKQG